MSDTVDGIVKLLDELTLRKLAAISLAAVLAAIVMIGYERYTSTFRLSRVEKAASAFAAVRQLDSAAVEHDPLLSKARISLEAELVSAMNERPAFGDWPFAPPGTIPTALGKFVAGAILWWILSLSTLRSAVRSDRMAFDASVVAGILGVVFGLLGLVIPPSRSFWFSYLMYPVLTVLVVSLVVMFIAGFRATRRPEGT